MPLKLGKRRPVQDPRTLRLGHYLDLPRLPVLPAGADWTAAVQAAGGYPMLKNSDWGDCAIAGPLHMIQTWTANAGFPWTPTDADALAGYQAVGGFDPAQDDGSGHNPTDNGCVLLDVLKYWRTTGFNGHKIAAFARIDSPVELQYATWLFGGALLGEALPDSVCRGDLATAPWDDTVTDAPNPDNGHCITAAAWNGGLRVVTWGAVKVMSWGFAARYLDEQYAVISTDWIRQADQLCPAGFDLRTLLADLRAVTGLAH